MTRYVTGKKGGGKSYFAMRILRRALLFTSICIITNLPIRWDKLEAYYKKHAPEGALPLSHRLKVISGNDSFEFFRHRSCINGVWIMLPEFGKDDEYIYNAKEHGGGVMYIIDEVHKYFNARRWQQATRAALDYMALEDKIGDQVLLVSQHLGQVDKYFRNLANEYIEVVNKGREMFLGVFRKPKMFEHITWYDIPNAHGNGRGPAGAFTLELDGLADCYDSAAGQGVEGLLNDRGESEQPVVGLPWWSAGVLVALVLLVAVKVPGWVGGAMRGAVQTMVGVGTSTNVQTAAVKMVGGGALLPSPSLPPAQVLPGSAPVVVGPGVRPLAVGPGVGQTHAADAKDRLVGVVKLGAVRRAFFASGLVFEGDEIEAVRADGSAVKIGGEWWF